jgi:hypothetical protein
MSSARPTRRLRRVLAGLAPASASAESFEAALLKLALPSGSLQDATVDLFARANFNIEFKSRDYFPDVDDPELGLISFRAQEVSRYVEAGVADCGITGRDWVVENGNAVRPACCPPATAAVACTRSRACPRGCRGELTRDAATAAARSGRLTCARTTR